MVWGVGQLASGPILTLTIIVINSDTQSSLFTGSGGRERGEISLFIGEGPFHQVQSFIIWADGVGVCVCMYGGGVGVQGHHN